MRVFNTLLCAMSVSAFICGGATVANAAKPAAKPAAAAKTATATLSIKGMDCEGCAGGIKNKLAALKGVTSASISVPKQEGVVKYNPAVVKPAAIVDTVVKAGYAAKLK